MWILHCASFCPGSHPCPTMARGGDRDLGRTSIFQHHSRFGDAFLLVPMLSRSAITNPGQSVPDHSIRSVHLDRAGRRRSYRPCSLWQGDSFTACFNLLLDSILLCLCGVNHLEISSQNQLNLQQRKGAGYTLPPLIPNSPRLHANTTCLLSLHKHHRLFPAVLFQRLDLREID